MPDSDSVLSIDIAIIGGGIQGLWLLADLTEAGYEAILLEQDRLGCDQTSHSHVFLHQGHLYASIRERQRAVQSMKALWRAHEKWKGALGPDARLGQVKQIQSDFLVGWNSVDDATYFDSLCNEAGIPPCSDVQEIPKLFAADQFEAPHWRRANGFCLEANHLLPALLKGYNVVERVSMVERVGRCDTVSWSECESGLRLKAVRSGQSLEIEARGIVLGAGAGNEKLISECGIAFDADQSRQQTLNTYMLVLHDLTGEINPVTGFFPQFGGIFIASRVDDDDRTVLLIADKQRYTQDGSGPAGRDPGKRAWFHDLTDHLYALIPSTESSPERFKWAVYPGRKAELWTKSGRYPNGGAFPSSYHVHKNGSTPVWLVWPTLLTFAPQSSKDIIDGILAEREPGAVKNWDTWRAFRVMPEYARERWRDTEPLDWQAFKRAFLG